MALVQRTMTTGRPAQGKAHTLGGYRRPVTRETTGRDQSARSESPPKAVTATALLAAEAVGTPLEVVVREGNSAYSRMASLPDLSQRVFTTDSDAEGDAPMPLVGGRHTYETLDDGRLPRTRSINFTPATLSQGGQDDPESRKGGDAIRHHGPHHQESLGAADFTSASSLALAGSHTMDNDEEEEEPFYSVLGSEVLGMGEVTPEARSLFRLPAATTASTQPTAPPPLPPARSSSAYFSREDMVVTPEVSPPSPPRSFSASPQPGVFRAHSRSNSIARSDRSYSSRPQSRDSTLRSQDGDEGWVRGPDDPFHRAVKHRSSGRSGSMPNSWASDFVSLFRAGEEAAQDQSKR